MAIVNRTRDSFYDRRCDLRRGQGAGAGARGGRRRAPTSSTSAASRPDPGEVVDAAEEIRRTVPFVAAGARGVPRPGDQRRHLAGGGRPRGVPRRRRPAQRRLGRLRPRAGRGGRRARRRPGLHAHQRRHAAHAAAPPVVRRRGGRRDRGDRRARRAGRLAGRAPRQPADRPGPRLRQEHLALAGADPAARRDGRDRLAGAGVAVPQGLRGRDPRRGRSTSGWSGPWPRPRSAPGTARGSSACTTSPRPGRLLDMVASIRGTRPPARVVRGLA